MALRMAGMLLVLLAVGLATATDFTIDMTVATAANAWLSGDCSNGGTGATMNGDICVRSNVDESDEGVSFTNSQTLRFNITSAGGSAPTYTQFTIESKARNGGSFSNNFGTTDNLVLNLNAPSGKVFKMDLAKVKLLIFSLYLVQETVCTPQTGTDLAASQYKFETYSGSVGAQATVLSSASDHTWWKDLMNAAGIGHVVVHNEITVKPTTTTGTVNANSLKITIALPKAKACNSAQTWRWLGQGFELNIGSNAANGVEIIDAPASDSPSDSPSSSGIVSYALMTLLAMLAVAFSAL